MSKVTILLGSRCQVLLWSQRERNSEELKSKGRIERERQNREEETVRK